MIPLFAASGVRAIDTIELIPTENHHIAELNSDQPYVAGYHVKTPDLETREAVYAKAITVSFPSTDTSYFPSDSWLGGGMFVQAQDNKLKYVDYGFYTMLVLDAAGNFFFDVGLHQTREETAPIHMPTEELVYACTWQIRGIEPETPITLTASWDLEGWVHYSISAPGFNATLPPINVADLQNCQSIIRRFYAGNVVVGPFPFTRYVQYFQFGVVSSMTIANNHWFVDLKEPRLLRQTGWAFVDTAWSIEGDISYLDYSWMWGGYPYSGVSAQYYKNPLENPREVIFFYNAKTLPCGTILWQPSNTTSDSSTSFQPTFEPFKSHSFSFSICTLIILVIHTQTHSFDKPKRVRFTKTGTRAQRAKR